MRESEETDASIAFDRPERELARCCFAIGYSIREGATVTNRYRVGQDRLDALNRSSLL